MKRCIFLFRAVFFCTLSYSQNTNSCIINNAGFESGNTSGWICKSGYYGDGACPTGSCPRFQTVYTKIGQLNPGGINAPLNSVADRHVLVTGSGTDPNSNNVVPVVAPGGGNYSFRVGNAVAGGDSSGKYAQAEAIRLTFPVTSQNAAFTYRYAFFIQDPNHKIHAQPTFEVVAMDSADNPIPCGRYFVIAGFPGCSNVGNLTQGAGLWQYKNWTDVGMDLTPYIGHSVSVEFRTFDCFPGSNSTSCINNSCTYCSSGDCCTYVNGGTPCTPVSSPNTCYNNLPGAHSAYAYIDAYCSPLSMTPTAFCVGAPSLSVCAPNGYSSYSWPAGQPGLSGSPSTQCVTINNPVSGTTYTVNMISATGCKVHATATLLGVTAQASPPVSICAGTSTTLIATGNGAYSWNTGATTSAIAVSPSVTTGYSVAVTNGACTTAATTTVSVSSITLASSTTQAGCTKAGGTATANPSGGFVPYTYLWTPGNQNTQTATGLSSGTYTVLVTDAAGCTHATAVSVAATPQPSVILSSTPTGCSVATGTAKANPSGGTPGYTFLWMPGNQNTQTATGLSGGTYSVLVTDANGCTASATVAVNGASGPTMTTASSATISCYGGSNGIATATVTGGTPPYVYQWSDGQSTTAATGLSAGTYTVMVTDANHCSFTDTVTLVQPAAVIGSVSSLTHVSCNGQSDGKATITAGGGTPSYTYSWSTVPVQTTPGATGLAAGSYTVLITDSKGCIGADSVKILQPKPLMVSVSGQDSICFGEKVSLTGAVTGGTPSYTYVWSPGPQTGSPVVVSPTSSTVFSVVVTDAHGCTSIVQTCTVTVLPLPAAYFDTASAGGLFSFHYFFTDSSIGAKQWVWNFGDGTGNFSGQNPVHNFPGAGTYTVTETVYNQFGCPDTFETVITIPQGIIIPNVFTPNHDGHNDVWYIPNSGMLEYNVEIFDRWGEKVWEATVDEIRWDGRSMSGKPLSDGTYYYILHAVLKSGAKGKDYSTKGYITLLSGG